MRCPGLWLIAGCLAGQDAVQILTSRCQPCHGPALQSGGLRLDSRESIQKGGYRGPSDRLIVKAIREGVDGKRMPPTGPALRENEIVALERWLADGYPWTGPSRTVSAGRSRHWAFEPVRRPALPSVRRANWVRTPIDRFILARLEHERIEPSPEADRPTVERRLHLDLTGLPPEPGQGAHVEELLRSPHYGERWALPWLDLAHYGDSDGHEQDGPRPHAWRYRDWLIGALNRNLPFDRFTVAQLAGDLLSQPDYEATGFLRSTLTSREGGIDPALVRDEQLADRVSTVGTVWLGLTTGCARCHDHKFDPFTQREFYQLYAIFNRSREVNLDAPLEGELARYEARRPEYERRLRELVGPQAGELLPLFEKRLWQTMEGSLQDPVWRIVYEAYRVWIDGADEILRTPPDQRSAKQNHALMRFLIKSRPQVLYDEAGVKEDPFKGLLPKLEALDEAYPRPSEIPTFSESATAAATHVLIRGDYKSPGVAVPPLLPASVGAPSGEANRLTLARWLVSRENPLTARVTVNRIWQEFFGRGLVPSSEDLGKRAERPSHPELLEWLAAEFLESGWNVRHIQKLIVDSATYRQSSRFRPDVRERDPDNRLLARQSRLRLRAELVRDMALAASGLLNRAVGGPAVKPPMPESLLSLAFRGRWTVSPAPERHRRGIYVHVQRTLMYPQLQVFDAPDRLVACTRRSVSTSSLQALTLLNDPVFHEAARALAGRIESQPPADRIPYAFQLCFHRAPSAGETARLHEFLRTGSWTEAASSLLNLEEFIVRE